MRHFLSPAFVGLLVISGMVQAARAQARADCPVQPRTLAAMRGCYRPLLVFAPASTDQRLAAQRMQLDQAADDMMDRFVMLVPVVEDPARIDTPLDAPYALLPAAELDAARRHYKVARGSFAVLLLGEDGGIKFRSNTPVPPERLNNLIDTMPTRKAEMRRPHAN